MNPEIPAEPLPPTPTAAQIIAALDLQPLDQEGGYFRRTAEAGVWVQRVTPPGAASLTGTEASRAYSVIYALFTPEGFSALHRLATDEIWCWHAGDSIESLRLGPDGSGAWVRLGPEVLAGERPQDVIAAGVWQGTRLVAGGRWALVSCVLAPEFRWMDFELGDRAALTAAFPDWAQEIVTMTRAVPVVGRL